MQHLIPAPLPDHARNLLRRAGYGEHTGHEGKTSFTKRMGSDLYPRFHAYIEDRNGGMQVNLHLDQKQASYEGSHAHGGEYEGTLVTKEMERIKDFVERIKNESKPSELPKPEKKGGWLSSLWG